MNISELKDSKFLRKEDCGRGILVTIDGVSQENIAKEGAPEELKWVMYFRELDKPLVLNSTNGQILAKITGSEESDDWNGTEVVLFHDPNVSFGGKLVGGIRVRAPRKPGRPVTGKQVVPAPEPTEPGREGGAFVDVEPPADGADDDLPF